MKRSIALFEIFILVLGGFSFAHFMGKTQDYFPDVLNESNFIENSREIFLDWLGKGLVSAQEVGVHTCLLDINGDSCQEYPSDTCESNCTTICNPGSREEFSECILGTCFDTDFGDCDFNVPYNSCVNGGGEWYEDTPALCNRGCCLYEGQGQWVTNTACDFIHSSSGVEVDFRSGVDEQACVGLIHSAELGACVYEADFETTCSFVTGEECANYYGGEFYAGFLCSHPDLNTNCEKQVSTGCVDGKDEVYWFDSCGNRENVYHSNKVVSWNDGKVLSEASCDLGIPGNAFANQESCGNCNRAGEVGSVCGSPEEGDATPNDGEFVCRDLACTDKWGERKEHGESWCEYESAIGFDGEGNEGRSVEVPGSRHYRMNCVDGEIRVNACGDGREKICVESVNENGVGSAACKVNQWRECVNYNIELDMKSCEANDLCEVKEVSIDSNFAFNSCVPRYPPNFDLEDENGRETAELVCGIGSAQCKITYVKKISGKWKCVRNCECLKPYFTESMNNLCISLGDCGASYNLGGYYGENYIVGGKAYGLDESYEENLKNYIEPRESDSIFVYENLSLTDNSELVQKELGNVFNIFGSGLSGNFGERLKRAIGVPGFWGLYLSIVTFGLIPVITNFFGLGLDKTRMATFECLPWEPPAGGENCENCGENGYPCSEYKCKSLGKNCKFLNEGEGDERCYNIDPNDFEGPVISPLEEALSEGYVYVPFENGFKIKPENKDCIPAWTSISFGIELNELGECKIDKEHTENYDDMTHIFGKNHLAKKHDEKITLPSLDILEVAGFDPERTGDYNLFIRCIDYHENVKDSTEQIVNICVSPEIDDSAPELKNFDPENNGIVSFGVEEQDIEFYTNEPAECKWSLNDITYDSMQNDFVCENDVGEMTIYGFKCYGTLPVTEDIMNYYIRCKDQPWLDDPEYTGETDDRTRNTNQESVDYRIERSSNELEISSVSPNNETIVSGFEPVAVELEIHTSGGANGEAICKYSLDGGGTYNLFFNTKDTSVHTQTFSYLYNGIHEYPLLCEDKAGNIAEGSLSFDVEIDDVGPFIAHVYELEGKLRVITNEESECAYSFESCSFGFDDEGVSGMTGTGVVHSSSFGEGLVYKVKCKDSFGNIGMCLSVSGTDL